MRDAPERMWASKSTSGNCVVSFSTPSEEYCIEYVRADIHRNLALDALAAETQAADAYAAQLKAEAMAAKLAEALTWARNLLEPFADPELSLGLGERVIPKIDAAIAEYLDNR